tara:strand:+ start:269 stop:454 length:186 start_codon:yes stop_codon:yes gene_type:complete
MNLSFSVTESEYKTLRALILVAHNDLHTDLDNLELSDTGAYALSRQMEVLENLKRVISDGQ